METMSFAEALEHLPDDLLEIMDNVRSPYWYRMRDALPRYWLRTGQGKKARGWCSYCEQWSTVDEVRTATGCDDGDCGDVLRMVIDADDAMSGISGWSPTLQEDRGVTRHGAGYQRRQTGVTQGRVTICPKCRKSVIVKEMAREHRYKYWENCVPGALIIWTKSRADPVGTVCAIKVEGRIRYDVIDREKPNLEQIMMAQVAEICVFSAGRGAWRCAREHAPYSYDWEIREWIHYRDNQWSLRKDCRDTCRNGDHYALDAKSRDEALRGTRFEWLLGYGKCDETITITARASRYGVCEMLHRRGWHDVAEAALINSLKLSTTAMSIPKALRITPEIWRYLKGRKEPPTQRQLYILQDCRRYGVSFRESLMAADKIGPMDFETVCIKCSEHKISTDKTIRYIIRRGINSRDWCDYIRVLHLMDGLDVTDESTVWPSKFAEAHDRAHDERREFMRIRQAEAERARLIRKCEESDANLSDTVTGVCDKYRRFFDFDYGGMQLRMFATPSDVIREGAAQRNCVGTYLGRYAKGEIILCSLRRAEAPDQALYTVELSPTDGSVRQCRGYHNDVGPDEQERLKRDAPTLNAFWTAFAEHYQREKRRRIRKGAKTA